MKPNIKYLTKKQLEFQIKQNWKNSNGWIYFKSNETDIEKLKQISIRETRNDWDNINPALYFAAPEPCRPTIYVTEYDTSKPKKDRIQFKTTWR
jgi:hypothetical protein